MEDEFVEIALECFLRGRGRRRAQVLSWRRRDGSTAARYGQPCCRRHGDRERRWARWIGCHPSVLMVRLEPGWRRQNRAERRRKSPGLLRGECGRARRRRLRPRRRRAFCSGTSDRRHPDRIVLGAQGDFCSSISAIPARSARAGATMARRSLAHNSQADYRSPAQAASAIAAPKFRWSGWPSDRRPRTDGQRKLELCMIVPAVTEVPAAGGAFVGESLSPVRPGLVVIAGRAAKARGPTRLEQPRRAGGLIRKATLKIDKRRGEIDMARPRGRKNVRYLFLCHGAPHVNILVGKE